MIENSYTDMYLPVCQCGDPFSDYYVTDGFTGRLFCMRCKMHPTLQAIPVGEMDKHKARTRKGYFQLVKPDEIVLSLQRLKGTYDQLGEEEKLSAFYLSEEPTVAASKPKRRSNKKPRENTVDGGNSSGLQNLQDHAKGIEPDKTGTGED